MRLNNIFNDDCKNVLKYIKKESVDLIYLDPPFFTQKVQKLKTRDNSKEYSFNDVWESRNEYISYIKERLVILKNVMKNSGSIFLHCDNTASHVLRLALEEVFSEKNFQNEIIWTYKRWSNSKKGLLEAHQNILFFSKSSEFKFKPLYQDYSPSTNIDQIVQKREKNEFGKTIYSKKDNGDINIIDDKKGVPLNDVWDIPYLNPKAKERVGFPTQKPINLLERIINLATEKNDVVLDPFCGSGSFLVAAKILDRKYIGIDINKEAVDLARSRLKNPIKTESVLMKVGRGSYKNQKPEIEEILNEVGAVIVQRNKGIDGLLRTSNGLIPIKIHDNENEEINEIIAKVSKAILKNSYKKAVILSLFNTKANCKKIKSKNIDVFYSKNDLLKNLDFLQKNRSTSL